MQLICISKYKIFYFQVHIDPLSVRRELTDRLRMLDCTGIVVSASDLTTFKDAFSDLGHESCASLLLLKHTYYILTRLNPPPVD